MRATDVAASIALTAYIALAPCAAAADEASCWRDIARATSRLQYSHRATFNRCIRNQNFAACPEVELHIAAAENDVRKIVASPGGDCAQALAGGTPLGALGPATCPSSWTDCDVEVPAIASLDDLSECLVCIERGVAAQLRSGFGLPPTAPASSYERKCISRAIAALTKALRQGRNGVDRCASGNAKPFACPVDDMPGSGFDKALAGLGASLARCKDAAGTQGALSGGSAALCDGASTTPVQLAQCLEDTARCLTCSESNAVFEQSQDCVAFSTAACANAP